ncbi:MAG: SDR family NAD(P)-dependent oxidoreductase [Planctomycetaceae bacterium]|nr:SDR family NAD(P)-dependent oxidoreductase [Planctomycetaceae bacterium]
MSLHGKVAIITGASAGIGREVARRLAQEHADVVLAARSVDRLNALAEELEAGGTRVLVVPTDVADPNDLVRLAEETVRKFHRIDILINNAGVECFRHFEHTETDDILQTIETNLTGAILLTRLIIPQMLQQKSGVIINMASTAGKHTPAFAGVYGATKAALIGFTQGLRGEFLKRGISATAVCPGFTRNGGIYDRIVEATGKRSPAVLGGTTTQAVANAVLKAIHGGAPEIIVNWPPVRPAIVLREVFPRLGELLTTAVSRRFTQRAADAATAEHVSSSEHAASTADASSAECESSARCTPEAESGSAVCSD